MITAVDTNVLIDILIHDGEYFAESRSRLAASLERGALILCEAVYAELHANFPDVVREGFAARVWIVSPTTCMATLNTMRAVLKDARMREQAGAIRRELSELYKDVERLSDRVGNLDRHFGQAAKDLEEIKISSDKASRRARRLDNFDFEEIAAEPVAVLTPKALP